MGRILVVDDKELMRDSVATTLARKGHAVTAVASGAIALQRIEQRAYDVVLSDLQMPEMDGLQLLSEIGARDEQVPVILMTAYGSIDTAVTAMKNGAFDYILKPFNGDILTITIDKALSHAGLVRENQVLRASAPTRPARAKGTTQHELIGISPLMEALRGRLQRIADSHGTVLVTGESGSGKEVAARLIHELSPRAKAPFLAINCAALSTNLLESELFGHEKGAFTGADKLRKGRFELADGGTLLLDEISEIDPQIQAKLLRVLQERVFERVGSSMSRAVDVRLIATSNRDLEAYVAAGGFRQDLYFRLNVLPVAMPPLRRHVEDLPELVEHFLREVAVREGRPCKQVTDDVIDVLAQYDWPGNVRELQNICERAAVLTTGDSIKAELVRPWLSRTGTLIRDEPSDVTAVPLLCDGTRTLEEIERETIIATLHHHNGHRQRSAAALGIGVRTLGLKLKKWKEQQIVSASL